LDAGRISAQLDPFSVGRFNYMEEVDYVIALLKSKIGKLRELSPLWEKYQTVLILIPCMGRPPRNRNGR